MVHVGSFSASGMVSNPTDNWFRTARSAVEMMPLICPATRHGIVRRTAADSKMLMWDETFQCQLAPTSQRRDSTMSFST